ncbi:uncharacterized protein LOC142356321 isoform X2 [Convolutriloba macropyga]|uniref:uncharacterized protein LOC142356321 isoform X2 n=1 Tax=Convolutriloba macropyga TaxID=536237 RepID=UPI003F528E95
MKSPDFDKLPLAVGKPIITRVTEDSVTLNWNPGNNPSPEYNVEMYSYETHVFAWNTVGEGIYSNLLTVGQLSPNEDYEFLVRGVNNLGVGLPSHVSSRVRTVERNSDSSSTIREEDIKSQIVLVEVEALEGTTVNSTSAWIQWNVLHNSYFVQGFTIKYTEHDGGNAYPSQNYKVVEVNDPYARAVLVSDLQPWSSYMATIQPYYESVAGIDSQHIFFTTPEGTPRDVVSDVTLHQMSGGRYMVTWSAPFKQREGHIIGYSVALYFGDSDIPYRTLNTTETKCTFSIVDRPENFRVSIAARTNAGVGIFSPLVSPNDIPVQKTKTSWIIEHPWVLAIAGALVWIALAIVSILIWRRHKRGHYKSVRAVKLEQSLQPPSEYAGGQWQVILPPSAQHNMTLMHGAYMPQGPSGTLCPPQTMASSQGPDVGHFMGGSMAMGNIPVTLKSATNSNYAAHPECYQPLVVNISSHKNPNESLYQCGDCYEECNPVQCNNHPTTTQLPPCNNTSAAATSAQQHPNANQCSCHYSNQHNNPNLDPNNISVVYHPNSSPEYHQHPNTVHQCHAPGSVQNPQGAVMATPKFTTNPNRYQQTPPRRSPAENLYNELDQPKIMSEMMHSPVGTSPGSNQSFPTNNTTPSRLQQQQGYPMTVLPSTVPTSVTTCTNLSLPPHPVAANTLSNQQQQPQIAPTISAQVSIAQQSPAQPPRMSCPRMGLSGVNRANNVNNSVNNTVNNMASSNDYVNTNTTSIATNAPIGSSMA